MVARFGNLETVFKKMDENGDGVLDREALFSLTFCVVMTVYACIYACACHETLFSLFGSTTRARACMCHVRASICLCFSCADMLHAWPLLEETAHIPSSRAHMFIIFWVPVCAILSHHTRSQEIDHCIRNLGFPFEEGELDAFMKHADANGDGKIQYKEWLYKLSGGREGGDAKG